MNPSIREAIAKLATEFADAVLATVSSALADALAAGAEGPVAGQPQQRRPRLSGSDLRAAEERVLTVLRRKPAGVRAEALRAELGISRAELGRPLKSLLGSGQVGKTGDRRSTVYRIGSSAAATPAEKPPAAKKSAGKATRAKKRASAKKAAAKE
jgi:hypothetical protein